MECLGLGPQCLGLGVGFGLGEDSGWDIVGNRVSILLD